MGSITSTPTDLTYDNATIRYSYNDSGVIIGLVGGVDVVLPTILLPGASGSRPTASVALRGCLYLQSGGAGVADQLQCCMKSSGDTYSWVTVTTAS